MVKLELKAIKSFHYKTMKYYLLAIIMLLVIAVSIVKTDNFDEYKPRLVIVGGGSLVPPIRERFINMAGGINSNIVIIPSASSLPDRCSSCTYNFKDCLNIKVLDAETRNDANSDAFITNIQRADALWFSGGDQKKLLNLYKDTRSEIEFHRLLRRGKVIGGTSAGASIMGTVMPYESESLPGFGFIDLVIDQHFNTRSRLRRLQNIIDNTGLKGIGIDESTALVIDGDIREVIGLGKITEIPAEFPGRDKIIYSN